MIELSEEKIREVVNDYYSGENIIKFNDYVSQKANRVIYRFKDRYVVSDLPMKIFKNGEEIYHYSLIELFYIWYYVNVNF